MTKKYQVFVSSTYTDLIEERQAVSRAILDMGHIPAGMEMFPAADIEQLTYIKKVIDECDYYVLILGGRCGSLDPEGVSYTEREYDYAVSTGKSVLAFPHKDMDQIPFGKTDKDDAKHQKFVDFHNRVCDGRMVQFWTSANELRANAIVSLQRAFSETPQVGWVRADTVANTDAMADIIKYRNENDALKQKVRELQNGLVPEFSDAAGLDEEYTVNYTYINQYERKGSKSISFANALSYMAPQLNTPSNAISAEIALKTAFKERLGVPSKNLSLRSADVQDILMHLVATGHVHMYAAKTIDGKTNVTAYQLTPLGVKLWKERSYVKARTAPLVA